MKKCNFHCPVILSKGSFSTPFNRKIPIHSNTNNRKKSILKRNWSNLNWKDQWWDSLSNQFFNRTIKHSAMNVLFSPEISCALLCFGSVSNMVYYFLSKRKTDRNFKGTIWTQSMYRKSFVLGAIKTCRLDVIAWQILIFRSRTQHIFSQVVKKFLALSQCQSAIFFGMWQSARKNFQNADHLINGQF